MLGGRTMPDVFSRSANLGDTPVALNRPKTRPPASIPSFSKTKMSCMATTSPDMPVISVTWVMRRVPSLRRAHLHNDGNRRCDLLAKCLLRQIEVRHQGHGFQAGHRIARAVGVDGGQRPVVAGVHRLQHVEGLLATHLADDDPVRPHTQGVDDQFALPHGPVALPR